MYHWMRVLQSWIPENPESFDFQKLKQSNWVAESISQPKHERITY